jgi:hypothetical protein
MSLSGSTARTSLAPDRTEWGLGLSIAQAIARMHGSEIHVESTLPRASRFFLSLSANLSETKYRFKAGERGVAPKGESMKVYPSRIVFSRDDVARGDRL